MLGSFAFESLPPTRNIFEPIPKDNCQCPADVNNSIVNPLSTSKSRPIKSETSFMAHPGLMQGALHVRNRSILNHDWLFIALCYDEKVEIIHLDMIRSPSINPGQKRGYSIMRRCDMFYLGGEKLVVYKGAWRNRHAQISVILSEKQILLNRRIYCWILMTLTVLQSWFFPGFQEHLRRFRMSSRKTLGLLAVGIAIMATGALTSVQAFSEPELKIPVQKIDFNTPSVRILAQTDYPAEWEQNESNWSNT